MTDGRPALATTHFPDHLPKLGEHRNCDIAMNLPVPGE